MSNLVDGILGKLRGEVSNKMRVNEVNKGEAKNDEKQIRRKEKIDQIRKKWKSVKSNILRKTCEWKNRRIKKIKIKTSE